LPAVAFFKPVGIENAHPGYADVTSADQKVRRVVEALQKTSLWKNTLVIVTFDEHGGFWDPKAPPKVDRWGPGARIPAIFVYEQGRRHFVDHTQYETTSILAFLERRFGLLPLTERDRDANPLLGIF
jgi:acid phosphatase